MSGLPQKSEDTRTTELTMTGLAVFWAPLALMWIVMAIEQPALNGLIARLPRAAVHLAAFEVAFGLALVIESPILQMLSASTALARGRESYRRLLNFMHGLGGSLVLLHVLIVLPPVFAWLSGQVLGVPEEVRGPAREVLIILIPFAPMVGYRRFWQGALIRAGLTGLVARTMIIRLVVTIGGLAVGLLWFRQAPETVPGGHVLAAWSLVLGVIAGAIAAGWYAARRVVPQLGDDDPDAVKGLPALLRFYVPLSLTSVMLLASRPVLAYGMSRSVEPVLSLAAWPVVQSVLFLFTSIALSYQEAVVAQRREDGSTDLVLRRFGLVLGCGLSGMLLLMSFSGGARLWFRYVAGLTPELVELATPAMMILVAMPLIVSLRSYVSGRMVARERTGLLGVSVGANTTTLVLLVVLLPTLTSLVGAILAAIAFVAANTAQLAVLWLGGRRRHA